LAGASLDVFCVLLEQTFVRVPSYVGVKQHPLLTIDQIRQEFGSAVRTTSSLGLIRKELWISEPFYFAATSWKICWTCEAISYIIPPGSDLKGE